MAKYIVIMLIWVISGCTFDEKLQYSLMYPATVEIINNSNKYIRVRSIYGAEAAKSGFILRGGDIAPGHNLKMDISEYMFDDIVAGFYIIEGECGKKSDWKVDGLTIKQGSIENTENWSVSLVVMGC